MLKNAALSFAKKGLSIFPLHPRTKNPLVSSWTPYRLSAPTLEQICDWWQKEPNANIALPTGQLNRIAVVDLDGPTGLASGKFHNLNSPVQSITGREDGGRQLFYRWTGDIRNSTKQIPGIDVRGEGGYVVLPPSVHPSGKRYAWLNLVLGACKLPDFPHSIFTASDVKPVLQNPKGWIAESLNNLSEGNRNDTFFRIASRLRNDGYSTGDINSLLQTHAEKTGFDKGELEHCIRSTERYSAKSEPYVVSGVGQVKPLTLRTWENSKEEYQKRKALNTRNDYPSGFSRFDRLTNGFQRGEISIIAARTGTSKTNVVCYITRALLAKGKSVLIFSTEMSFDRIWDRIGVERARDSKLSICDDLVPDIASIRDSIKSQNVEVIVFDHINHIGDDYERLSAFIHGLKNLASELQIPIVVTAQLSRAADLTDMRTGKRAPAQISHIKGSGTIEQVAAHVLLISEIGRDDQQVDLEAHLAKNRYGEQGKFYLKLLRNPWRLLENS